MDYYIGNLMIFAICQKKNGVLAFRFEIVYPFDNGLLFDEKSKNKKYSHNLDMLKFILYVFNCVKQCRVVQRESFEIWESKT